MLPQKRGLIDTRRSNPNTFVLPGIDHVQRPVRQELAQFNQLLQAQRKMPPGTVQLERQVTGHDIGAGQGFAEVGQQTLCIHALDDGEQLVWGRLLVG